MLEHIDPWKPPAADMNLFHFQPHRWFNEDGVCHSPGSIIFADSCRAPATGPVSAQQRRPCHVSAERYQSSAGSTALARHPVSGSKGCHLHQGTSRTYNWPVDQHPSCWFLSTVMSQWRLAWCEQSAWNGPFYFSFRCTRAFLLLLLNCICNKYSTGLGGWKDESQPWKYLTIF